MIKAMILLFAFVFSGGLYSYSMAGDSHNHQSHRAEPEDSEHDTHDEFAHEHDEEGTTKIHKNIAEQVGIKTAFVGSESLHKTVTVYGRLTTGPEQTSHVRARFPGVITSVNVTIGDQVKPGDLLAVVESNESLKRYELRSPISGTVTQRHANTGEMTREQVLFSITNSDSLWAELRIFPSQKALLLVGQRVRVELGDHLYQATIAHLLPAEGGAPYFIARAELSNLNLDLFPGLMIEASIVVSHFDAALAVQNVGLQSMGGLRGVFARHDDNYIFTPLTLGHTDGEYTQVLSGVTVGSEYVTKNSFLIKADIEKSEAEHEH